MSEYIVQDLLALILKRLPVKTLLRCQCVCKSWKQLIASKSFIQDHLTVQRRRIILQNDTLRTYLLDPQTLPLFDTLADPIAVKRADRSCFGFTLSSVNGVNCVYNNANILLLFNPSIRKLLRIPIPELSIFHSSDDDFRYCGFWIDPCNNEFKVAIFCVETRDAVLFSSKEQTWMEVAMGDIGDYQSQTPSPQVTVNGVAHWTTYIEGIFQHGDIIYFDFEQHKFGSIKLPPVLISNGDASLCKWQDSLSVVYHETLFSGECHLWVMQNGSWCNMFRFRFPGKIAYVFCVLGSLGRVLALNYTNRLVVDDPKHGLTCLKIKFRAICSFTFSYDFVESLVFPDQNCISSY